MHMALHPKQDIYRPCKSKKEGKGLTIIEDSVDTSVRRLEDYKKKEPNKFNPWDQKQYKQLKDQQKIKKTGKQKWRKKQL